MFSGISEEEANFETTMTPIWSEVYAEAAGWFTKELIKTQRPWLPNGTYLNINFPRIDNDTDPCANRDNWRWVFTREIKPAENTLPDMPTCGHKYLPLAQYLIRRKERVSAADFDTCYATVSLLGPKLPDFSHTIAEAPQQGEMYQKIGHFMSCPPPFYYQSNPHFEDNADGEPNEEEE